MLKKGLLLATLIMCVFGAIATKRHVVLDKIVAVVGGSSILYSEVEEYANQLIEMRRSKGYTSDRDPMNEALEAMLTQKLLFNQAQIDSVEINSMQIASQVESQVQNMISTEGSIKELETKFHMEIFNIREMMRIRYEEQSYATAMQQNIVNRVKIIPGEVDYFYKNIDKDSLPIISKQYVYAQIIKFPESIIEAKQRTKERLLSMRELIMKGETKFSSLARSYSVDGSAFMGGEMDPQPLHAFVQPFSDALADLKDGQVSEVVETQFGFHLIERIGEKGGLYHCRHILLRPTYTSEEVVAPTYVLDSIVNLIRKDSITFEAAALEHSDDAASKMNGGIVSNLDILEQMHAFDAKLTVTKFLEEDFGARGKGGIDDYNHLRSLEIGDISDSYMTEDMKGNQLSKIVTLVDVIPAHKASLNDDYIRLEQMALVAKQERIFNDWLTTKIDGMYVFISPEFHDGEFVNKSWIK